MVLQTIINYIFKEMKPIDVAKLKIWIDDYVEELLQTQTKEDEQAMLEVINNRTYPCDEDETHDEKVVELFNNVQRYLDL